MKRILAAFFVTALSTQSYGYMVDLSKPEANGIAAVFKGYDFYSSRSFSDTGTNESKIAVGKYESDSWGRIWVASIGSAKNGEQQMYFSAVHDFCDDKDEPSSASVFNVEGKNVRFTKYCNGEYREYFITTRKGEDYVLEQFKKRDMVSIKGFQYPLLFDAAGFTKAWNSFGGDAL